ncbi:hypothetical protein LXL04_021835 [Taraxacum kok-saghyz]
MYNNRNRRRLSLRQAKFALRRLANTSSNPVEVGNSDDENQNNVDNQNIMIDSPINVINPEINNENNLEINNENIDEDLNMNINANEEVSDTEEEIDENQLNIIVQSIQENQNEEDDDESIAQKEARTRNLKVRTSTSGRKRKMEYKGEKRTSTRKNTNPYATITPFKCFRTTEMSKRIRSNENLKKDQKASKRLTPRKKTIQEKEKKMTESASTSTPRRSKRTTKTDKEKQSKELTVVKQPKKKKRTVAVHRTINDPFGLRVKTSPAPMLEAIKFMSADQRDAVSDMGFGAFLDMKMEQVPAKPGHFLVENLDDKNLVLRIVKRYIQLTTDVVHEVFGIPNGGLDIDNIKPVKRANEIFKLWKSQYPENIARSKILEKIRETDDDGIVFKLNFITLFVNCFCETYTSVFCKKNIVYKIAGVEEISELDWCSYVLKVVRGSKNNWVPNDLTSIYAGPIAFLVLTYMKYTRGPKDYIPRIPPSIEACDFYMVKRKEKKELERGGFGCFEEDEDQDLPEEDLMDIRSKMRKICRYETELLETFWKYLDKDPQDEEILNLKEEYHIMFGKSNNSSSGEEDDGDDNRSDDDNNDEGDGNDDRSDDDADNNKSDDGNSNKGGDGIDQEGDNAENNEDGGDADKNEDAGDAYKNEDAGDDDKNEDVGDADKSNKGNDDDLLNTETRENVGGEAISSETRKTIGCESMETNVVNTESEIIEDQTPKIPQPTSHPVEELKKDSRLRDPRLKPTNNATDLKNQMPSSSTTAASSKKILTKDEPKYTIFDDEPISEYMLQVCIELENIALSGKIDKNYKRYIYVNHGAVKTEQQKNDINNKKIQVKLDTKDVKDEGPNFDLGISQEFSSVLNDIGAKPVDTEGKPVNVPLVNPDNEIDHDIEDETPLIKRLRNPSKYKVSPYYKKNVEVLDVIKPIELTISNRLFALDGDVHSTVFETEDGINVSRVVMETLIPNTWIVVDLLNVWTMILNYEEGLKTRVNAKKVYFNVIVLEEKNFDKDANLDELYKIFEDKANDTLKMWKIKSLKKVNLVYFPIFHYDHYYIYVFDLKTNRVHLFDNRKDFPADGYNKSPKRMCYTGGVISKFDCGLVKKSEQQSAQLIKLRKKYATKILMSDLNIKMKSFLEDANSFQKIEESTRKNILYNAYKDRQKRFDFAF